MLLMQYQDNLHKGFPGVWIVLIDQKISNSLNNNCFSRPLMIIIIVTVRFMNSSKVERLKKLRRSRKMLSKLEPFDAADMRGILENFRAWLKLCFESISSRIILHLLWVMRARSEFKYIWARNDLSFIWSTWKFQPIKLQIITANNPLWLQF